jgi:putative transposase
MPRYKRIREPGLLRHVMSRGNGRMRIFLDDTDYRTFLYILSDVLDRWDVDCWDMCVMPNHYHLALLNRQPTLPEALQHLNGEYALWWNARHGRVGHVFQGRYKDQIVQRDGYLRNLLAYIAMNPVRAGLVKSPELWPWSGYGRLAGLSQASGFISVDSVLAEFGDDDIDILRRRYVQCVAGVRPDEDEWFKRFRSRQRVLGDRQFKHEIQDHERFLGQKRTAVRQSVAAGVL